MQALSPFQPPLGRTEVVTRRAPGIAMILLIVFFGGLCAATLASGRAGNAKYFIGLFMLALLAVIGFLFVRGQRNSVRFFDADGIERGDGRHLPWSEFKGMVRRLGTSRFGGKYIWRIELYFTGGQAWILPSKIKNGSEVLAIVNSLPELRQDK